MLVLRQMIFCILKTLEVCCSTNWHRFRNRPADAGVAKPMRQISRKLAWAGALLTIVLSYAWLQFATLEVCYQKEQLARENQRLEELLDQVKVEPGLEDMVLVKNSRLSVQPVTDAEWKIVCRMGGLGRAP